MKTKTNSLFFFVTVIAVILSLFTSCSKKAPDVTAGTDGAQKSETASSDETTVLSSAEAAPALPEKIPDSYLEDKFIGPKDFFTLDYTPYLPESESAVISKTNTQAAGAAGAKGTGSQSVVPGLRAITEYKTDYSVKKTTAIGTSIS